MKQAKHAAQAGFTLIELIVVIVILGILAATALPKFMNMGGDARLASLNAALGAVKSTAAMTHGAWQTRNKPTDVSVDGVTIDMDALSGYPKIGDMTDFLSAAGITADDYIIVNPGATAVTTGNNQRPATTAAQFAIIPKSADAMGDTCNFIVTLPIVASTAPTYTAADAADDCI
jgi:MSHA pilin protein MshA